MQQNVCIVLPTYNEQDTIRQLIAKIMKVVSHADIIIVDDSYERSHRKIVRQDFRENGFILLSESAYALHMARYRFPTTFLDRKHGSSSVTLSDLFLAFIGALRIRMR